MNPPDSSSLDTWHKTVNCFAWGGPSSPITLYSGTCMSCVMHNSCNEPTAFSCSTPLYGDATSDISIISSGLESGDDVPSSFNFFRIHLAASCFASFFERPLPVAGKNSYINVKHYSCWVCWVPQHILKQSRSWLLTEHLTFSQFIVLPVFLIRTWRSDIP